MNGLYILAVVLLVLFLAGQIRVGVRVEYSGKGLFAWARLGFLRIQVFPFEKKDKPLKAKKKPREKPKKETAPKPLAEKIGGALDYAQTLLPIALEAAGCFYQKLWMDTLELELTVGADDPADAALRYGQASAALGALWYPLTQAFHVEDGNARVRVDFDAPDMAVYAMAALSLKVGQILRLGLHFGFKALRAFLTIRKRQRSKQQERKAA